MKPPRPAYAIAVVCALVFGLFNAVQASAASNDVRTVKVDRLDHYIPAQKLWEGLQAGKSVAEQAAVNDARRAAASTEVRRTGPAGIRGPVEVPAVTGEHDSTSSRIKVSDVPIRTMTREECAAATEADATMWIRSRFAMCESTWLAITWLVNGKPVGVSQFTGNAIATIPDAKSREISLDYYFHDFVKVGTVPVGTVLTPSPEYTTVPSVTLYEGGSTFPMAETWEQWAAQSPMHESMWLEAPLGQGMAPDDGIWAVWNFEIDIKYPAGWIPVDDDMSFSSFGLRWDFAPYLGNTPGASLSYDVSPLRYSKTGNEGEVAQHIDDAFNRPERTLPLNPDKNVPGASSADPLHRLYELYEPARYEANRDNAIASCVAVDPDYASKGFDCDEYPFASTFEGTARADYESGYPRDNWSARALGLSSNRSAGAQLNTYYTRNRILHGENDEFYLEIIP